MKTAKLILILFLVLTFTNCVKEKARAMLDNPNETPIALPANNESPAQPERSNKTNKEWLSYDPTVVELRGKLVIKTFFGPPNFGENPETDSKERSWILTLTQPINVRAKTEADPILGTSVEDVLELQLVLSKPQRELIGKNVIVKGTLFHAHTGHHHTDVLMDVELIKSSKE